MAHDPENDTCESSPFESCICHLGEEEQDRLIGVARSVDNPPRLTPHAWIGETDDELMEIEES